MAALLPWAALPVSVSATEETPPKPSEEDVQATLAGIFTPVESAFLGLSRADGAPAGAIQTQDLPAEDEIAKALREGDAQKAIAAAERSKTAVRRAAESYLSTNPSSLPSEELTPLENAFLSRFQESLPAATQEKMKAAREAYEKETNPAARSDYVHAWRSYVRSEMRLDLKGANQGKTGPELQAALAGRAEAPLGKADSKAFQDMVELAGDTSAGGEAPKYPSMTAALETMSRRFRGEGDPSAGTSDMSSHYQGGSARGGANTNDNNGDGAVAASQREDTRTIAEMIADLKKDSADRQREMARRQRIQNDRTRGNISALPKGDDSGKSGGSAKAQTKEKSGGGFWDTVKSFPWGPTLGMGAAGAVVFGMLGMAFGFPIMTAALLGGMATAGITLFNHYSK